MSLAPPQPIDPAKNPNAPLFEYQISSITGSQPWATMTSDLNRYGEQGWDLVTAVGQYLVFRRGFTPVAPTNTAVPSVQPLTAGVGDTLTCTMGEWDGTPTDYAYQWLRDGTTNIGDGTNSYLVDAADAGTSITCVVTATNAIGSTAAPPSNAVAIPAAAAARQR